MLFRLVGSVMETLEMKIMIMVTEMILSAGWENPFQVKTYFKHDMSIANSDQTILQQHSSMSRQIFPRFQILTDNDLVLLVFSRWYFAVSVHQCPRNSYQKFQHNVIKAIDNILTTHPCYAKIFTHDFSIQFHSLYTHFYNYCRWARSRLSDIRQCSCDIILMLWSTRWSLLRCGGWVSVLAPVSGTWQNVDIPLSKRNFVWPTDLHMCLVVQLRMPIISWALLSQQQSLQGRYWTQQCSHCIRTNSNS